MKRVKYHISSFERERERERERESYVDDVLSLNYSRFGDYLYIIYPNELEVDSKATQTRLRCS